MEERLVALHATAKGLCAPAFAGADPLNLFRLQRHGQKHMEWPILRRRWVFAKHDLIIAVWDVERRSLRVDLDHAALRVAARRHKCAFQRTEWKALAAHQFGQHLGNVLRLTRSTSPEFRPRCPRWTPGWL